MSDKFPRGTSSSHIEHSTGRTGLFQELERITGKRFAGHGPAGKPWAPLIKDSCRIVFRCAETGRPFGVQFVRKSDSERYHIVEVTHETAATDTSESRTRDDPQGQARPANAAFDASQFDFTGWFCPQCTWRDGLIPFVHCAKCGEYVCGGRVRPVRGARGFFTCHDGCGNRGEVDGFITWLSGEPVEAPPQHSPSPELLGAPPGRPESPSSAQPIAGILPRLLP